MERLKFQAANAEDILQWGMFDHSDIEAPARSADPARFAGGQSAPSKDVCHSSYEYGMKTPEYEMNMNNENAARDGSMNPASRDDYIHTRDMIDQMQARIAAVETTLAKLISSIRKIDTEIARLDSNIIHTLEKIPHKT